MYRNLKIKIVLFYILLASCNYNPLGGKSSHIDEGNTPFLKKVVYGYFSNRTAGTITRCVIDSKSGAVNDCILVVSSGLNNPMQSFISNGILYVPNYNGNFILQYAIDPLSGLLSNNLVTSNLSGGPASLIINGGWAYVTLYGISTVMKCAVNPNGTFSSCASTPSAGAFSNSSSIVINNSYAYITSTTVGSKVYKCTVNTDGTLSACVQTPTTGTFTQPIGITINNGYAYIANAGIISKCTVNADGTLSSCSTTALTINNSRYLSIYNNQAYITSSSGLNPLWQCTVNGNGTLTGCFVVLNIVSSFIDGISIQAFYLPAL